MAINYCDWVVGDDVTGDGTFGSPYQTITKASDSLTGGDEVRVAKSLDDTDLSGTLDFVNNSTSVTTSVDLTGELNPGDFFYKNGDEDYLMEVISIAISTITLYKSYRGTTESSTSKKLGVTITGNNGFTTPIQIVSSSGVSTSSRLKISGGWDLSSQTQTGETNFNQIGTSISHRYGYGLQINAKNYLEIEKLGFFRNWYGLYFYQCDNSLFTSLKCISSSASFYISYCTNSTFTSINIKNNYNGIQLKDSTYNVFSSVKIFNCGFYGFFIEEDNNNNTFNNITCKYNTRHGIYIDDDSPDNTFNVILCEYNLMSGFQINNCINNTLNDVSCHYNNITGIYLIGAHNTVINNPICNNNNNNGIFVGAYSYGVLINNAICNNNIVGIYLSDSDFTFVDTASCDGNDQGISMVMSGNNIFKNITCNNNDYGVQCVASRVNIGNIINNYSGTGNMGDIYIFLVSYIPEVSVLQIQHFKTTGDNRSYYINGVTYRDTVEAQSTQCLKYSPTSDTYYIRQEFAFTAIAGVEKTISFYIKDDTDFDGDVQAALFFMEENITGWNTILTTEEYIRHTLIAQSTNITEDGVVKLRIKVRGTAGNVYVDDLGAS